MDRRLGNTLNVHHQFVPALWDAGLHGSDNPFLNLFSSIDLVFIFQVVLSLLALLFAYDAVAGEREGHTLRLIMTNPVSRSVILLAKYVSAMLCLIVPLIISLLLAVLLFTISGSIVFSSDDFLRILAIVLISIIYLSAFYLIGLLISTVTRRTATALMLSIFVWVVLVLIYPSLSVAAINRVMKVEAKLEAAHNEIQQIWDEFNRERTDLRTKNPFEWFTLEGVVDPENGWHFAIGSGSHSSWGNSNATTLFHHEMWDAYDYRIHQDKEALVPDLVATFQSIELARRRTAGRAWLARKRALAQTYGRKAKTAQNLIRLSPAAVYDLATEALAGTDLREIERFIEVVRQYRQTLIEYFRDKDAFSSHMWFSSDKEKVSWDDLLHFSYHRSDFLTSTKDAALDLVLLLLLNVVLFMATFLIFMRQEV